MAVMPFDIDVSKVKVDLEMKVGLHGKTDDVLAKARGLVDFLAAPDGFEQAAKDREDLLAEVEHQRAELAKAREDLATAVSEVERLRAEAVSAKIRADELAVENDERAAELERRRAQHDVDLKLIEGSEEARKKALAASAQWHDESIRLSATTARLEADKADILRVLAMMARDGWLCLCNSHPPTCIGMYEGTAGLGCDHCCGHSMENGWCVQLPALEEDDSKDSTAPAPGVDLLPPLVSTGVGAVDVSSRALSSQEVGHGERAEAERPADGDVHQPRIAGREVQAGGPSGDHHGAGGGAGGDAGGAGPARSAGGLVHPEPGGDVLRPESSVQRDPEAGALELAPEGLKATVTRSDIGDVYKYDVDKVQAADAAAAKVWAWLSEFSTKAPGELRTHDGSGTYHAHEISGSSRLRRSACGEHFVPLAAWAMELYDRTVGAKACERCLAAGAIVHPMKIPKDWKANTEGKESTNQAANAAADTRGDGAGSPDSTETGEKAAETRTAASEAPPVGGDGAPVPQTESAFQTWDGGELLGTAAAVEVLGHTARFVDVEGNDVQLIGDIREPGIAELAAEARNRLSETTRALLRQGELAAEAGQKALSEAEAIVEKAAAETIPIAEHRWGAPPASRPDLVAFHLWASEHDAEAACGETTAEEFQLLEKGEKPPVQNACIICADMVGWSEPGQLSMLPVEVQADLPLSNGKEPCARCNKPTRQRVPSSLESHLSAREQLLPFAGMHLCAECHQTIRAQVKSPEPAAGQRWFNTETGKVALIELISPGSDKTQVAFRDATTDRLSYSRLSDLGPEKRWRFLGDGCAAPECTAEAWQQNALACALHKTAGQSVHLEWVSKKLGIKPKRPYKSMKRAAAKSASEVASG